jgi:hypothetical protein
MPRKRRMSRTAKAGVKAQLILSQEVAQAATNPEPTAAASVHPAQGLYDRARQNQAEAGKQFGRGKAPIAFGENAKSNPVNIRKELCKMYGITEYQYRLAQTIKQFCDEKDHPEVWAGVMAGTLKLSEAKGRIETILACEIVEAASR